LLFTKCNICLYANKISQFRKVQCIGIDKIFYSKHIELLFVWGDGGYFSGSPVYPDEKDIPGWEGNTMGRMIKSLVFVNRIFFLLIILILIISYWLYCV